MRQIPKRDASQCIRSLDIKAVGDTRLDIVEEISEFAKCLDDHVDTLQICDHVLCRGLLAKDRPSDRILQPAPLRLQLMQFQGDTANENPDRSCPRMPLPGHLQIGPVTACMQA